MPVRTCVACRKKAEKNRLLRWVIAPEGAAVPDPRGVRPGRGAYLCRREECLDAMLGRRARTVADFRANEAAFRLAVRSDVVQNGAGEPHEN